MTDPFSTAASLATVSQGGLGLLQFLWSKVKEADVIAALFDADGNRIEGDDQLAVERHPFLERGSDHWWYVPNLPSSFECVPYSVNPYLEIKFGQLAGSPPRPAWRWTYPPEVGFVWNGERVVPNAPGNFIVVGYRPTAIVRHFVRSAR